MEYQEWLDHILELVKQISSREMQQEAWILGKLTTADSPIEMYELLDDTNADEFFNNLYATSFSVLQLSTWKVFRDNMERYWPKVNNDIPLEEMIDDPEWQLVREAAKNFLNSMKHE